MAGVEYTNPPQSRNEEIIEDIITGTEYTDPPQSRNEAILVSILNDTEYTEEPQSRMEDLLLKLKEYIKESGTKRPYRDIVVIPDRYNTGCTDESILEDFDTKFPNVGHAMKNATITANGGSTTFENLSIYRQLTFKANEIQVPITFKNCKFYGGGSYALVISGAWSETVAWIFEDCEFDGFTSACCQPADRSVYKRCKIHNIENDGGKGFSNGGYEDCYFYDIGKNIESSHADGIQTTGYNKDFYIKNCRFDVPGTSENASNAGLFFIQEQDSIDARIEDVLMFGGNYSFYLGLKNTSSGKVIVGLTGDNIKAGYGDNFGIFNCNYAEYQDWVEKGIVSRQDQIFISSVYKENGVIVLHATNYTNEDRELTLITDEETKIVTVPRSYTFAERFDVTMEDFPFDLEYTINGTKLLCYDKDTLIRTYQDEEETNETE